MDALHANPQLEPRAKELSSALMLTVTDKVGFTFMTKNKGKGQHANPVCKKTVNHGCYGDLLF